jgi:flagellar motor switch protein FliN/FliY
MDDHTDHLELQELAPPGGGAMAMADDIPELARSALELAPVYDVPVNIKAVLGRSTMDVANLLKLGAGSLIELDRKVGEAIDIYVNNRLVARGELVVVEDRLGVTMTEIIKDGDGQ